METLSYQKAKDKMVIGKPHISIITLNVNELNSPIKRHRATDWIKKQNPTICCLQETHLSSKEKYRLKKGRFKDPYLQRGKEIRHTKKKINACIYIYNYLSHIVGTDL